MIGLVLKFSLIITIFAMQKGCIQNAQPEPKSKVKSEVKNEVKSETKMENAEAKNLPKLEANISLNDKILNVEYKVQNTTDKTIYLFNVLWNTNAEQSLYVYLLNDKTLFLAKHIPKLPLIKSFEFREIPYVTKVEAGKEFSEKISLPVPVEEFNPYFPKTQNSTTEPQKSETAVFSVQFIRETDGLEIKETKINNAFSVWHRDLFGNVETLQTKQSAIFVQVNKRTDQFERF